MLVRFIEARRAVMPWTVMVASAPPTWAKDSPALCANGSTFPIEVARSCMCILPEATVATSSSVT